MTADISRVKTPKVSVIIPVYNVEKYLDECLTSVINQTLKDIEIICIDDGSTDNSLEILKEYASKDDRIKVLHQKNKGVSTARNLGIKKATGKYLMFLDADDWYNSDTCETAYNNIEQAKSDICVFAVSYIWGNNTETIYSEMLRDFCKRNNLSFKELTWIQTYCWNKIYRADFVKRNKILFPKNVKTGEDGAFCCELLLCNPKYSFIEISLYNYRRNNPNSACNNTEFNIKYDFGAVKALVKSKQFKTAEREKQLLVLNKFLGGMDYYFRTYPQYKEGYLVQIKEYLEFLLKRYSVAELETTENFRNLINFPEIRDLVNILTYRRPKKEILQLIFSVRNSDDKRHKVVTILGVKINIRRKNG